jgi:hypothetical protein
MEWTTFQLLKAIKLLQENWELYFVLDDDYGSDDLYHLLC